MSDTQEKKQYEGVGFVFDIDGTIWDERAL